MDRSWLISDEALKHDPDCNYQGMPMNVCNCQQEQLFRMINDRDAELEKAKEVLAFYANPETYFAIGILPDSPCGDFITDFDDSGNPYGVRAGKRARAYLKIEITK